MRRLSSSVRIPWCALLSWLATTGCLADTFSIPVGEFSSLATTERMPAGWKPLTFGNVDRHTKYRLVKDGDTTVLEADSNAAASGLIRRIDVDPKAFPVIRWRWKVKNILDKGDVLSKQGDDYPARLYITFAYDDDQLDFVEKLKYNAYRLIYGEYPPLRAISYLWESKSPTDTLVPNAYTERVMMIVAQSGTERIDQWVEQERNVYRDYIRAFGEPPPPVSGVAVMTDTDNTGEKAVAYYGDIFFTTEHSGIESSASD